MDKYEISIWEDYPDSINGKSVLKERKIAVIGSDTMEAQARALEPNLVEEINGTNTFTFKMYYTYTDNETGEKYENPFGKYLINERKVKVFWKDKWYDMVIKKCQEDTSKKSITYTCKDLFINELSKQGYSLEFNTDLMNNIGTAGELAKKVLEGSTWQYDEESSTPIIQKTEGPVYEAEIETNFCAIEQLIDKDNSININKTGKMLVFYDSVVNILDITERTKGTCQFLYTEDAGWATDINDALVTNGKCCTVDCEWYYSGERLYAYIDGQGSPFYIIPNNGVSNLRGARLVKSQKSIYDALLDRYVGLCEDTDGREICEIATTEYSNPLAVVNLIANPSEFTSTAGWIGSAVDHFGIYPKFGTDVALDTYHPISYLKLNAGDTYNTALSSNVAYFTPSALAIKQGDIGGIQKGERYILRAKIKSGAEEPSDKYVHDGLTGNVYKYDKTEFTKIGSPIFISEKLSDNEDWTEYMLTCTTAISAKDISDYGLFITTSSTRWIQDIQFFKYQEGILTYEENAKPQRMNPNEISLQSIVTPVYKYYYKENDATKPEELTYLYSGEERQSNIYTPTYNNYEKIGTINEKESNRFNILQSIAETFQAWVKFRIEHEENGAIAFDEEGNPKKYVYFVQEVGEDTGISFEYGIDLKTLSRTIDSDKLATKVLVLPNSNEFAKNGFCTIARSDQNYSKEAFILNLDYYTQQNLIDAISLNKDLYGTSDNDLGYYYWLHKWNKEYDDNADELSQKNIDLTKQEAQKEIYEQYLLAAAQQLEQNESDLKNLAGVSQWSDVESYARAHASNEKVQSLITTHGVIETQIDEYQNSLDAINNSIDSLKSRIEDLESEQSNLLTYLSEKHKAFNDKYSTYIMEGTWQDEDYVDDTEYFLDGLNVAYTSSRPQLSYSINVLRLSSLDEYSSKIFNLGDICYMQDREFFGYLSDKITPYKEKILVSKISSFFDQPEKDVITVQNYKTRFDDLFQRIAATTQSLSYAEGSFTRAAGAINPDGTISFAALQDTFDYNEDLVLNSSNQDVVWDDTGITVTNKYNPADKTKIIAGGIFVTNDGGETWKNAIRGDGISTELLTAGRVNTSEIYIYDGNAPSFRWDSNGITAYASRIPDEENPSSYNFGKFVRHDQYGIYGYDGGEDFIPTSIEQIKKKSRFGLTWDGFFLKSNGTGGIFEISTENDLVVKTKQENSNLYDERVKIGRVGKDEGGNDIYGIVIKNYEKEDDKNVLKEVFKVDNNSATIAGWNMNSTSIEKNGVGLYSTPVDGYYIKAGKNFGVKSDGSMFAASGTIGGWKIESGCLSSTSGNAYTRINADGTLEGRTENGSYWSIKRDGHFYFNDSVVGSEVTSQIVLGPTTINNTEVRTTNINASGGSVGGWGISSNGLTYPGGGGLIQLQALGAVSGISAYLSEINTSYDVIGKDSLGGSITATVTVPKQVLRGSYNMIQYNALRAGAVRTMNNIPLNPGGSEV